MSISTCVVSGNVVTLLNASVEGCIVTATIPTPFIHTAQTISGQQATTTTDASGNWSLTVIETATVSQRVTFIFDYADGTGGRRKKVYYIVVPNAASAAFSDLVDVATATAAATFPATYVTVTPSGNLSSTNVQAALVELQLDIDSVSAGSLPSQVGNSGKYLTTDGSSTSWGAISGTGVTTVGTFGSTPAAGGASIASVTITMQPADATNPGGVSTSAQTFAGVKTFGSAPVLSTGTLTSAATTQTFPSTTQTLVGLTSTDTLTNKTLTAPVIATISNTGTLTLPTSTDTLVGRATTDTLTNKTLTAPVVNSPTGISKSDVGLGNVDNTSDVTKNAAAVTLTNKTITAPVIATIVNTGTLTLPTSTDTLVGRATTDTLTNKTLTTPNLDLPVVRDTATATKTVAFSISGATAATATTLTFAQTTARALTFPDATDTLVGKATTDVLTNKTLTAPKFVDGGFIADSSGNEEIVFGVTASAVNEIKVTNAATAGAPKIAAQGGDTNVSLLLDAKGTGVIRAQQALITDPTTLSDGANIATDASLSNHFRVTLAGNRTLDNPTGMTDGQKILFEIIQDATGSRTLAYGSKFTFGTDVTSPTLTTTASKRDYLGGVYNASEDKLYVLAVAKGY